MGKSGKAELESSVSKLHLRAEKVYANQMTGFVQIWSILGKNSFCIPMTIYCSIFLSHGDSHVIKGKPFYNPRPFPGHSE